MSGNHDPAGRDFGGDVPIDGQGLGEDEVRLILERRRGAVAERAALGRTQDGGAEDGRAGDGEAGDAVIVCLIGGERFAVPLAAVAEVLPAVRPVRVPTAPAALAGLITRRGVIYNLVDPAAPLGVEGGGSVHALLLRGPVPRIALRVDEAVEAAIAGPGPRADDGGLTETRFRADGTRIELIRVDRLVAALGLLGKD